MRDTRTQFLKSSSATELNSKANRGTYFRLVNLGGRVIVVRDGGGGEVGRSRWYKVSVPDT
jgi:hypothetical protein